MKKKKTIRAKTKARIKERFTSDEAKIKRIQRILGVTADGIWGPESQGALDALIAPETVPEVDEQHRTYASSFADPADIEAFEDCKAQGKSDNECFEVGDNGVGCWGDSTVKGTGPACALPPEYMEEKWGSVANAKNKKVKVLRPDTNVQILTTLKDRMPHVENLHNKAHIDINYDACKLLGWEPPIMEKVIWWWI
jgi:hypothetical protein